MGRLDGSHWWCTEIGPKSYWYLVEYVWKRGSWVAADDNKIGGVNGFDLMALSSDNELACSVIRPLRCWAYSWHHQERNQAW